MSSGMRYVMFWARKLAQCEFFKQSYSNGSPRSELVREKQDKQCAAKSARFWKVFSPLILFAIPTWSLLIGQCDEELLQSCYALQPSTLLLSSSKR
eukprot:261662-Amphidinium_carterae.2